MAGAPVSACSGEQAPPDRSVKVNGTGPIRGERKARLCRQDHLWARFQACVASDWFHRNFPIFPNITVGKVTRSEIKIGKSRPGGSGHTGSVNTGVKAV
jgi:hypothetical protein